MDWSGTTPYYDSGCCLRTTHTDMHMLCVHQCNVSNMWHVIRVVHSSGICLLSFLLSFWHNVAGVQGS